MQIKLKDAPLLHQFLKRLFEFDSRMDVRFDIGEELFIEGRCGCQAKDCATVYLRRNKQWDENILGSYIIELSKGTIILHFDDDGYFELEALCYTNYPYKYEIQRVLNNDFSAPRASELKLLEEYFADLENKDLNIFVIDDI